MTEADDRWEAGLFMQCEDDELSPAQKEFYEKSRKNYEQFQKKIDEYIKMKHGVAVIEDEGITVLETVLVPPPAPVRNQQFRIIQVTGDNRPGQQPVPSRQSIVLGPKTKPVPLKANPDAESPKTKAKVFRRDGMMVITNEVISEVSCRGGLTFGTPEALAVSRSILGSDMGVPVDGDLEMSVSKTAGKTYPSLMVFAKPRINPKAGNLSVNQSDRSVLDGQVKGLLMLPAHKFCEWLLQQGLVCKTQNCPVHAMQPMQLVQIAAKENKFVFTDGMVWHGECCKMSQLVSVFNGSIFESSPHPPSVILKLIYHWACQTNVPNVLQWVQVNAMYVRNFYSLLRAVCVLSMHTKFELFGGANKRIEVAYQHVRARGEDLYVVGILDPLTKRVRLRAIKCGKDKNRSITKYLSENTKLNSIICCSQLPDSTEILKDFTNIDRHASANKNLTTYLRETVAKFSPTNFPISRVIFQQFLDELAWRERWGPNSMSAFSSMIKHISDFTNENCVGGIIKRLIRIAADPFLQKLPADVACPVVEVKTRKRAAETVSSPPAAKKQSVGDKLVALVVKSTPHFGDFWTVQPSNPDLTNELMLQLKTSGHIAVDSYYYGTIPGKNLPKEVATLTIKCTICQRTFYDCLNLMAHLVLHYQVAPAITGPLQRINQCMDCFAGFTKPKDFQSHVSIHDLGINLKRRACQICEIRFGTRPEFIFHMMQFHVTKELPYKCNICEHRTSSYSKIITHMKMYQWGSHLFCPFCLKTVKVVKGRYQQVNIAYFAAHIRRHAVMDEERCVRCKLRFVHPSLLKEHVLNDHISQASNSELEPYSEANTGTIMPPPGQIKIPPLRIFDRRAPFPKVYKIIPSNRTLKIEGCWTCIECEGYINPRHFCGQVKCLYCPYETNCEHAAKEHYRLRHDSNRPGVLFSTPVPTDDSMYCYCGYLSSGDDLAAHLVRCNETTAYGSLSQAKQAEEATLTVLNTVGLVRKSPEPVDRAENGGIITQSSESFINIVSVKSLSSDSGKVSQGCEEVEPDCYVVDEQAATTSDAAVSTGTETAESADAVVSSGTETAESAEAVVSSGTETAESAEAAVVGSGTETAESVEEVMKTSTAVCIDDEMVVTGQEVEDGSAKVAEIMETDDLRDEDTPMDVSNEGTEKGEDVVSAETAGNVLIESVEPTGESSTPVEDKADSIAAIADDVSENIDLIPNVAENVSSETDIKEEISNEIAEDIPAPTVVIPECEKIEEKAVVENTITAELDNIM